MNVILFSPLANVVSDTFAVMESDEKFVVVLVVLTFSFVALIVLGGIVAGVVAGAHKRRTEFELKRDMLDRGMSADEIATVIESTPLPEDGIGRWLASKCQQKRVAQRAEPEPSSRSTEAWMPRAKRPG